MIGKTIGKYRIVGQLGRGGTGTVYKAVDETLDREVAIKVLNPELAETEVMKRFCAEATILAKLNHPEIATIYELFRSETDLLMVIEFVRGETLDKLSDRLGPMPPNRAAYLIDKILSGLEHAHRAGIVHRDMKPANVMVTDVGGVKIMDFGIARVRSAEHVTVDGYMMGTPAYMPPEQVLGQEVDGRADLYSVGVVFYRLLTGALPFKADTALAMLQRQVADAPAPLHVHREGLPHWCETILQRALAKSPADRFQTAEDFRGALGRATGMGTTTDLAKAFTGAESEVITSAPQPAIPETLAISRAEAVFPAKVSASGVIASPHAPRTSRPLPVTERAGTSSTADGGTIVLRKTHFAWAGSMLAIVAVGVAVLAFVALRRPGSAPATTPAPAADASTASAPPAATAVTLPSMQAPPPPITQAAPVAAAAPPPAARVGSAPTPSVPTANAASAIKPRTPAATPTAGANAPAARRAAVKTASAEKAPVKEMLPLVFDARALVGVGDKQRERDAKALLADGKVIVTADNQDVLHSVPYESVISISYSRGRDPMWNSPKGPAPVARAGGGALGIFGISLERHWISLRTNTKDRFVILRFSDVPVGKVLSALEERTGRTAQRVAERKGKDSK